MKKKIFSKKTLGAVAIAVTFAAGISMHSVAAEDYQNFTIKSYGTFTYDDGDESNNNGHDHDLFIDTSDLANLATIYQNHVDSDIIDTLEGIKENTEKDKAAGANAVKELMQAFQDGVNKIYDKLAGLGFAPETNSPDDINKSIQKIYDNRYEAGKKSTEIFANVSYYTWKIPDGTVVPAKGTKTLTSPTSEEMFGTGAIFLGIADINAPVLGYGGIKEVSYSGYGTTSGIVYVTFGNDSSSDGNISYTSLRLMAYKP